MFILSFELPDCDNYPSGTAAAVQVGRFCSEPDDAQADAAMQIAAAFALGGAPFICAGLEQGLALSFEFENAVIDPAWPKRGFGEILSIVPSETAPQRHLTPELAEEIKGLAKQCASVLALALQARLGPIFEPSRHQECALAHAGSGWTSGAFDEFFARAVAETTAASEAAFLAEGVAQNERGPSGPCKPRI